MTTKTLLFFIDAVRPDYITEKNTPFMYRLKKEKYYSDLNTMLGFSSGIHPSIWTSQYQEDHGLFLVYSFERSNSPFKWMRFLCFVPSIIRRVGISALKYPFYASKNKDKFPKWYKEKVLPLPASIDPKQAEFFKYNHDIDYENTFFNILKENKISYFSCATADHQLYGKGIKIQDWKISEKDLDLFFVYETDPMGHYYGPKSKKMKENMNKIDTKIKNMYEESLRKYTNVNMFIFSDHGMVEIKASINVKKVVDKLGLKPVKDYIVFYDSTMARFKVKDKANAQKIIDTLSKVKHLTYIDDNLKAKYKIRFNNDLWGDLMFLADPGYRIFPDYFAPIKSNTKGMHGYWPEYQDSKGILISNLSLDKNKEPSVIDLMPTIISSMGLKEIIPKNIRGKSLL